MMSGLLGGALGGALATGLTSILLYTLKRRDGKADRADQRDKALRYLMLYIIQERAKELIAANGATVEQRRSLRHWHDLYHKGLGGNGDADSLMQQVDKLPVVL